MQNTRYFDKIIHTDRYKQDKIKISDSDIDKLEQAIDVHGYRGASKKKHNGVVPLRPQDKNLWKVYNKEITRYVFPTYKCGKVDKDSLIAVKVVAHCPNGNRIVGVAYEITYEIANETKSSFELSLLGIGNYGGKLK